ncbi:phytoene/squalene synthase family protein [Flexibacterium corallicola]|uniref:phytoene/squalene synthase family protein n=1 Tax=Flexibacterium corallicola TaxID=3037259 RepID=UPI00286F5FB4|nr:phytoene/squalene synthase family protein [Pseudovibrio sp. M1P-2-3]
MSDNSAYCREQVTKIDRDRYLSCLYAPEDKRRGLFALYAFNLEISRIREMVKDPLPGEVRLQWWLDAISGQSHGSVQDNPVAAELIYAINQFGLPATALESMIKARQFDLYNDPMPSLADLEGYTGETQSLLMQMAVIILVGYERASNYSEACGHGGVSNGITDLLVSLPWQASRRQQFIPMDVMRRNNVDQERLFSGDYNERLESAVAEMVEHAEFHQNKAFKSLSGNVGEVAPAFLPMMLNQQYWKRFRRPKNGKLHPIHPLPELKRQWAMWNAARLLSRKEVTRVLK